MLYTLQNNYLKRYSVRYWWSLLLLRQSRDGNDWMVWGFMRIIRMFICLIIRMTSHDGN